ncbi:MAG: cyclic pyranopterin monophosphate synthase MoaC [Pseudomonadota bacterium]
MTHVAADGRPQMVDVSNKAVTRREARARSRVLLPQAVLEAVQEGDIASKKGPVFATAIVAGVMAAKQTHTLIPFCHPLGLERCDIDIELEGDAALVTCHCSVSHRTGVEMEALTGASVAALTIYDMCKALSHNIVIADTRLLAKTGGKQDFDHVD